MKCKMQHHTNNVSHSFDLSGAFHTRKALASHLYYLMPTGIHSQVNNYSLEMGGNIPVLETNKAIHT